MSDTSQTEQPGASGPFGSFPWGNTQDCMACPFGLAFFALRNTKPEFMEHLLKAGMEMALAFKSLADSVAERIADEPKPEDGLQRITIS